MFQRRNQQLCKIDFDLKKLYYYYFYYPSTIKAKLIASEKVKLIKITSIFFKQKVS